eukprot:scaffold9286_cov76-Phaeocystis_antarctica.AAC.3
MGSWRVKAAPTRSSCAGPWPAWRALSPAIEADSPASVGRNSSPPGLKGCTHPRRCGVAAASVLRPECTGQGFPSTHGVLGWAAGAPSGPSSLHGHNIAQ